MYQSTARRPAVSRIPTSPIKIDGINIVFLPLGLNACDAPLRAGRWLSAPAMPSRLAFSLRIYFLPISRFRRIRIDTAGPRGASAIRKARVLE
jgi:hypothetical protein